MTNKCDKCGARTRWYDEKCPACGAVRTVELPATPIILPNFSPSAFAPRRAVPVVVSFPEKTQAAQINEVAQETQTTQTAQTGKTAQEAGKAQTDKDPKEAEAAQVGEDPKEMQAAQTGKDPKEAEAAQTGKDPKEAEAAQVGEDPKETQAAQTDKAPKEAEAAQVGEDAQETQATEAAQVGEAPQEAPSAAPSRFQRRLAQLKNDFDAWRAAFNRNGGNVTLPPFRAFRYALGIALELVVCPPCAIVAAYFFTRALRADRRARYHAAMNETEKARLALGVGVGVFALGLCAFMYYVHSHEIREPAPPASNHRLFR